MIKTLLFSDDGSAEEILESLPEDLNETLYSKMYWVSARNIDDIARILPPITQRTRSFIEDLIEDQRPRLQFFQTLEENDNEYAVIILKFPTTEIFTDDKFQFQIVFITVGNSLFTFINKEHLAIHKIMSKLILKNLTYTIGALVGFIIGELFEMGIRVFAEVEDAIEAMEREQFRGNVAVAGWLSRVTDLKGRIRDAFKDTKANSEVITELSDDSITLRVPNLDHIDDRARFLFDEIDNQRAGILDLINIHLSMSSYVMNRQFYYLTIIGSLLIIPTIVSGIFGMNVTLPWLSFWEIMGLILLLTFISWFSMKYLLRRELARL